MALYFASQGAGRLLWPFLANLTRLLIAAGGGYLALRWSGHLTGVFIALAVALCADRKSTRLNSSHLGISYAVFCLKKKSNRQSADPQGPRETRRYREHGAVRTERRRQQTRQTQGHGTTRHHTEGKSWNDDKLTHRE